MEILQNFWERLIAVGATPELWAILIGAAVALVLTYTGLWRIARHGITVVHEGGHALMAVLWGRRISGIKLHSNTSGVTISRGKPRGLGVIFTTLAGYPAPALLGLGIAALVASGRSYLGLVLLAVALVLVFLSIRNLWGVIVTAPLGVGFYYLFQGVEEVQVAVLTAVALFLTIASTRPIIELQQSRAAGEADDSDADQLQKLTLLIPGLIWVGVFLLISIAANLLALWLLVMPLI